MAGSASVGIHGLYSAPDSHVVYFEKQRKDDLLCGLHCLNNLLQGPIYDEARVSAHGRKLDRREAQLRGGQMDATYSNVSDSGFFSVTVIEECLTEHEYVLIPLGNPQLQNLWRDVGASKDAFICHRSDHWFSVRNIKGSWFKLDSLQPAPELIESSQLNAFVGNLRDRKWSMFIVRHQSWPVIQIPDPNPSEYPHIPIIKNPSGPLAGNAYLTINACHKLHELGISDTPGAEPPKTQETIEKQACFTGRGRSLASGSNAQSSAAGVDPDIRDALLESAILYRSSLAAPPVEPEEGIAVRVIEPNGQPHTRKFKGHDCLEDVFKWILWDTAILPEVVPSLAYRLSLAAAPNLVYSRVRCEEGPSECQIVRNAEVQDIGKDRIESHFSSGVVLRLTMYN